MKLEKNLEQFTQQFLFEPRIENLENFSKKEKFIVLGMGGSNLAAGLLKIWNPQLEMIIHKDYGLPALKEKVLKESLIIANSFSGNTEEVIDGFLKSLEKRYSLIVISKDGRLLGLAKENDIPYIKFPELEIQPRMALPLSFKALLKILGSDKDLKEFALLSKKLIPSDFKKEALLLAKDLKGFIPVIYSSSINSPLAYLWKIQFNETAKIPAFFNFFPELNHNEMAGVFSSPGLSKFFFFLFLVDKLDDKRLLKRMKLTKDFYQKKGLRVREIVLNNEKGIFYKIFSSFIFAVWTAFYLAKKLGKDPFQVEVIEEFKKKMSF